MINHSACDPTTDYIYFTESDPNGRLITSAPGVSISNEGYSRGGGQPGNAFGNIRSVWSCAGLCQKTDGCSAWSYLLQNENKCKLFDSKVNKNTDVPGPGSASDGNAPMFVSGDYGCGGTFFCHCFPRSNISLLTGQQVILKNQDDERKLSIHIFLQQTGVVLQVVFTGSALMQFNVTGGSEIYRLPIMPFLSPYTTSLFQFVTYGGDCDLLLGNQLWNLCEWTVPN